MLLNIEFVIDDAKVITELFTWPYEVLPSTNDVTYMFEYSYYIEEETKKHNIFLEYKNEPAIYINKVFTADEHESHLTLMFTIKTS